MRTLCCYLLGTLLFAASNVYAGAGEVSPLSEKVGKWSFSMNEPGADLKTLNKEKLKKIKALLQEISRTVTSTPAMKPPKGFEARFWGTVTAKDRYDACKGKNCPPSHPTSSLAMMIGRYEEKDGKIRAAFNSPSTMDISINNIGLVFTNLTVLYRDSEGYMLPEPKPGEERAGMTTYVNNGRIVAVIASEDRPLWLPVSRERYLNAAIETAEKEIGIAPPPPPVKKGKKALAAKEKEEGPAERLYFVESGRTWIDPAAEKEWIENSRAVTTGLKDDPEKVKERIQLLRKELDSLTPEQRTMQALIDASDTRNAQAPLLPVDRTDGVGVVTPNFAYFSKKLSVEVPQLITVQWKFSGQQRYDPEQSGISEDLNNQRMLEIYRDLDWGKISGMVTQTGP